MMPQKPVATVWLSKFVATLMLLATTVTYAADNTSCSSASLINPNIDGGAGGTGAVANGGVGGTGITKENGMGGTGVTASGGAGGTGITTENGMGGTGITADGGMGGTGISTQHGGIGGTGDALAARLLPQNAQGGIAIIGVVTGFASICVNGEEVFYDHTTAVFDNGASAKLSQLGTGKMVMLKADRVNGKLFARAIGIFDAVAGPIDKLDIAHQRMQVMGQTIALDPITVQQMRALNSNAVVRVSGHRLASGEIVATRVDLTQNNSLVNTFGIVTNVGKDGFTINGTRVDIGASISEKIDLKTIKLGSEVNVAGAWNGKLIEAKHIELQPIKNMINHADSAIIEGFAHIDSANNLLVEGTEVVLTEGRASYKNIANSSGKVLKMDIHRDSKGQWVCDNIEQRKGRLFRIGNNSNDNLNSTKDGKNGNASDQESGDRSGSSNNSGSDSSGSSGDRNSGGGADSGGRSSGGSGADRSSSGGGADRSSSGGGADRSSSGGADRSSSGGADRSSSGGGGADRSNSGSGKGRN